jgi:DNA-binding NarL/FixJ family response regulator
MKTKIVLYDDNEALGQSIRLMLDEEPDMEVIAFFQNAESVTHDIELLQPDVVLMDIDMPVVNGVEAVKKIRKINPIVPVLMLTVFDDNNNVFNAICAGASGYILKRNATKEIPAAIRNVLAGDAPMTGSIARKVLQMVPGKDTDTKTNTVALTQHEQTVLQFLVKGHSYKMIAAELSVSVDGVRFHIKKIYEKLHVHSATEAVSVAIKNKLIQ